MRRIIGSVLLVGIVSGCVNMDGGPETGGARPNYGRSFGPPCVPGMEGPYGTPVPMVAPYNAAPPSSPWAAQQMMRNPVPLSMVQRNPSGSPMMGPMGGGMPPLPIPPGGALSPPGIPFAPGAPGGSPMGAPGGSPMGPMGPMGPGGPMGPMGPGGPPQGGMGMPNGNVMRAGYQEAAPTAGKAPGEVEQAQFSASSPSGPMFPAQRTQVFVTRPSGMEVSWFTQGKDGKPNYSTIPLYTPGRYNFAQGAIYRLKLAKIPGRERLELYPTLEVVPTSPKTNEFLAHNSVPLEFTDEDFKQVVDRNYIVKVIYLPDPQFQDVAGAGPDEIVSTRLEPGQDPIQEALRRGSILLIVRIGNIDQNVPSSPSLTAPVTGGGAMPPGMMPPGMGVSPLYQVPYMNPGMPPGMMPPGMMPPGMMPPPVPPGLGAEAERAKPNQFGPLPPLPNEQNNKNNPALPFGAPPAKEGANMNPVPFNANQAAPATPLAPFPVLPMPNLELKVPAPDVKDVPPLAAPPATPVNVVPTQEEPKQKAPLPEVPVSAQKTEKSNEPAFPALPMLEIPPPGAKNIEAPKTQPTTPFPDLPKIEGSQAPPLPETPGAGKSTTPKTTVPSSSLPVLPTLPAINPELISGSGLPAIPPAPVGSEKQ